MCVCAHVCVYVCVCVSTVHALKHYKKLWLGNNFQCSKNGRSIQVILCYFQPIALVMVAFYRWRMWDMSRFVMITLLSLHSDKTLFFGAYKLLVTHLSRDLD